ncbi:MAG: hypothetical protein NWQ38_16835 [Cellulophaga sp.]|nr:hypothetical protein [Cellulophaga sp.]
MDKIQKLVLLILLIAVFIIVSCKKDNIIINFNHFNTKTDTVKVDFSLNNIDLITLIERQSIISLYDNKNRLGKIEFKNSSYLFPVIIDKNCNDGALIHNIIDIIINQDNQILVQSELVESTNILQNEL